MGGEGDAVLEGGVSLVVEEVEGDAVGVEVDGVQEAVAVLVVANGLAPHQGVLGTGLVTCTDDGVAADVEQGGVAAFPLLFAGFLVSRYDRAIRIQLAESKL